MTRAAGEQPWVLVSGPDQSRAALAAVRALAHAGYRPAVTVTELHQTRLREQRRSPVAVPPTQRQAHERVRAGRHCVDDMVLGEPAQPGVAIGGDAPTLAQDCRHHRAARATTQAELQPRKADAGLAQRAQQRPAFHGQHRPTIPAARGGPARTDDRRPACRTEQASGLTDAFRVGTEQFPYMLRTHSRLVGAAVTPSAVQEQLEEALRTRPQPTEPAGIDEGHRQEVLKHEEGRTTPDAACLDPHL